MSKVGSALNHRCKDVLTLSKLCMWIFDFLMGKPTGEGGQTYLFHTFLKQEQTVHFVLCLNSQQLNSSVVIYFFFKAISLFHSNITLPSDKGKN